MTPQSELCPHCGKAIPTDGLAGLCPACLLQQGFTSDTVAPVAFSPPGLDELENLFPQLEILELIGAGGMGAVYKARQRELDRVIALKILPPAIGERPGFAERFTREAKALARLSHPGIVTIHDTGRVKGLYFLLMEYIDGSNLRQMMEKGRPASQEALAIIPAICDALQFAHDAGFVHRDIKPENILIDQQGRVKVADFGLAKIVGDDDMDPTPGTGSTLYATEAGQLLGTPQYMAPEQIDRPGDVDQRADIYSLGIIFYQMLTGGLPDPNPDPPSSKAGCDTRLNAVVLRALEKNPDHRYQKISEIRNAIETITTSPNPLQSEGAPPMDITFNCPGCGQHLSVDPAAAGTQANCPTCNTLLVVPQPAAVPRQAATPPPLVTAARRPPTHKPASKTAGMPMPPKRAKALAIWAMILGILGLVPLFGLATGALGLLFGIIALAKQTTAKGMAIIGLIAGGVATLMIPFHLTLLKTSVSAAKFAAGTTVCSANMAMIGKGIAFYQEKNNGSFPPSLDLLVREGYIPATALNCPLQENNSGQPSYQYSRPAGSDARGIIVWDRVAHGAAGRMIGRNVLDADLSVRFLTEDQFRSTPKASDARGGGPRRPPQTGLSQPGNIALPPVAPPPPSAPEMTVESALAAMQSASPQDMRTYLRFLKDASVNPDQRGDVINALRPLLNDVDNAAAAFDAFIKWADKEEVPDLIEMLRVAPNSPRGKECMKLLARIGDERAAEPIASGLTDFHLLRDTKAALAALGDVAKPAVLPFYHHENRATRDAARELLRGYQVTDGEIFTETISALETGSVGARHSAIHDLPSMQLTPQQRTTAALALRPLLSMENDRIGDAARRTLKSLATPDDAGFLMEETKSENEKVRYLAIDLLVGFKDARVATPLATMLADPHQTYHAGRELIRLGTTGEPAVIPYLRHQNPETRKRAADTLAKIGTAASVPALRQVEKDENFHTRAAAASALRAIQARTSGAGGR